MSLRPLFPTLIAGALAVSSPALAEWTYSEMASASGAPVMHMAVTAREYHGLGLRCDGGVLSIQYLTNDPMSDDQMKQVNAAGVRLALRAGAQDRRIEGQMQRVPQGAVFVALAEPALLGSLEKAKGDVELALEFSGAAQHRQSFELEGAASALASVRKNCLA